MFCFRKPYFVLTVALFLTEVAIALFVNDRFVRPYFGDFLVVIFLYCFFRTFLNTPVWALALGVLLFAFAIEAAQYFHLLSRIGLQHNNTARVVLGSSFEWGDMLAYTLGVLFVLLVENLRLSGRKSSSRDGA